MYAGRWQRLPGLHTMFNPSNPQLQSPPDMSAEKDATPTPRVLNATGRRVRSPWTATRLKKKNRQDDAEPLPGFSSDEDTSDHDEEEQDDGESSMMVMSRTRQRPIIQRPLSLHWARWPPLWAVL